MFGCSAMLSRTSLITRLARYFTIQSNQFSPVLSIRKAARSSTETYRLYLHKSMGNSGNQGKADDMSKGPVKPRVKFSEEQLREKLSEEEYNVTQNKGTERAFSGRYWDIKDDGTYTCVVCGEELFKSDTKFDSGSGWPSFTDVASQGKVTKIADKSFGMLRVEVICTNCGAHLGHVFDDGPGPTNKRYCINSCSLKFNKEEK